ncbi:MAG: T9SS type A sorting domain-containing protein [Chitinophagaceae bacterium]|nr:T9SS type A sorting domain-containing protein [Chitinophagaceae bacterium]
MKKFLLLIPTLLAVVVLQYNSSAQINCTQVSNANNCNIVALDIKSAVTEFQEVGGFCEATMTLSFKLMHNSGMKYANLFFYNNAVSLDCKNGPSSTVPSSTASLGGYIALAYTTNWTAYNSGINGLTPQTSGYSVTATPITGGTDFVITGIKFKSGLPCGSYDIGLYLAGTNASSNGVQCHNQSSFKPYLVSISGKIDCSSQVNPLNYDLFIDANYENPPGTAAPITGTYQVYIDANSNNVIDGPDVNLTPVAQNFLTSTIGVPSGYTSRFASFDNVINLLNGDLNSTKNLLVRVTPTTPGVAAVTGLLTNTCSTLPVSLKNFSATQRNSKAVLTWETEIETNNAGFEIQRRLAGKSQYETLAFVDSKAPGGNGNNYSYGFNDGTTLPKGVTYYRLRQVDLDGKSTYSEIKSVRTGNGNLTISIYPNPSRGTVNVAIPESSSKMDVSLDDYTGKSIQRWSGISARNLQLNNLKPGVYMLRINFRETGDNIIERIIVQ